MLFGCWRLLGAVPLLLGGGCGWPFDCESERIEVTLAGTIERGETQSAIDAFGAVALGNLGAEYETIKAVLVGDAHGSAATVTWSLEDAGGGWLSFTSRGPHEVGAVRPVVHSGAGGWGLGGSLPVGADAGVQMQSGDFGSTRASGSLEVVRVEPLRFRVDVELADDEDVRGVRGEMDFALVTEDVVCE